MAETLLNLASIAVADQIEEALEDDRFTVEELREVVVDDLWNDLDIKHGSRVQKLFKREGKEIPRPTYVRTRKYRS